VRAFGFDTLYQAFTSCRRGKRGTRKAQRYEMSLLDNLVDTAQALQEKTWHPSRASRFVSLHPKPREILAADFGDRVVHHLLVPWFERLYEPVFIQDSYANRKGKGTHAAIVRLEHFLRVENNAKPVGWADARKPNISASEEMLGFVPQPNLRLLPNISASEEMLGFVPQPNYIVRPHYRLVRRRVVGHMNDKLQKAGQRCLRRNGVWFCPPALADAVQSSVASYFGHFRHAHSARLQREIFVRHGWLTPLLKTFGDGQLQRIDRPAQVSSLASQWRYFRRCYPGYVLMMQVGNRWECAAPQGGEIPRAYRLVHIQRTGMLPIWAVHVRAINGLKRALMRQGQAWCEIVENGYLKGGMKRRQLIALWPLTTHQQHSSLHSSPGVSL